jgi:hypothetical protein
MTDDVSLEAHEHRDHAERAAHSGDNFLQRVSITIAVLAVVAAAISSLQNNQSAAAISANSEAVLHQDRATDLWNYYQAKSIKGELFALAAERGGRAAAVHRQDAARYKTEQVDVQAKAKAEERNSAEALATASVHERRHNVLEIGETLLHVAIAVATIAIITRQRWPWLTSIGMGAIGAIAGVLAFV